MSEEIEHYIKSVLEQANLRILVTGNVKKDVRPRDQISGSLLLTTFEHRSLSV